MLEKRQKRERQDPLWGETLPSQEQADEERQPTRHDQHLEATSRGFAGNLRSRSSNFTFDKALNLPPPPPPPMAPSGISSPAHTTSSHPSTSNNTPGSSSIDSPSLPLCLVPTQEARLGFCERLDVNI